MEQVQFDSNGFAIESGYVTVAVTDDNGIYLHTEQQFVSAGCGLAANAYLDQPGQKAGFVAMRTTDGWQWLADHRGETVYSTIDKSVIVITEVGDYPDNTTTIAPECELCEWDGEKWVLSPEKQAERLAQQRAQMREAINALRDKTDAGGVFVEPLGKWIDSDEKAYQNILGVKASFDLLGDRDILWTWADNTSSVINRNELAIIVGALLQAKQHNHENALVHKNAVEQSENPLEYDYSGGWTTTYADFVAGVQNG